MRWFFQRQRFHVDVQEAYLARPRRVWAHLVRVPWLDGEVEWKEGADSILWDGTRVKVQRLRPPHELAFTWVPAVGDRTPVRITLGLRPDGRTQLRIQHRHLRTEQDQRKFTTRWKKVLRSLGQTL